MLHTIMLPAAATGSAQTQQAIAMIIYFVAMILIGVWAYTRTNTIDDYMLGGRELNPLVAALSAGAADMSGWLLMGLPGALYLTGLIEGWIAIGLTIGQWINWRVVAPRLRSYTEVANNSITVPSFLSTRVRDDRHIISIVAGIIFVVFFTIYVGSGLVSGGKFFNEAFGMNYALGMTIVAGIVVIYTLIGGFLAVSWTDMIQGLMMLIALITVPIMGLFAVGGLGEVTSAVSEVNPGFLNMLSSDNGTGAAVISIISNLAWGLGYFGMPHIIVRFMALKTPQQAKSARRIGMSWMIFSALGAVATAVVGVAMNKQGLITVDDPEKVFLSMGSALFHPFFAGFVLAAVLAAIMSTVSSQLLVTSSAVVEDIYGAVSDKKMKDSTGINMGRTVILIVTVVGALIALDAGRENPIVGDSILNLVAFAWAGFGAAFGPTIILALYWRRLSSTGAVSGMAVGAVTVILWHYALNNGDASWIVNTGLYEILPAFILNLLVTWLVSRVTYTPNEEIDAEFDAAVAMTQAKEYTPVTQNNDAE